jgi:hypothetical protein
MGEERRGGGRVNQLRSERGDQRYEIRDKRDKRGEWGEEETGR